MNYRIITQKSLLPSGAGEIRTLVQTRKSFAFYMLIFALIFELRQDRSHQPQPYSLNFAWSPGLTSSYLRYCCATLFGLLRSQSSGWHLVQTPCEGMKLKSTILRSSSESVSIFAS